MPMDGNHRLARLWDKYGPSHRITADLEVFTDPIDVKGFLSQIRDVQDLGIRTFADFLQMCREGNFDRD